MISEVRWPAVVPFITCGWPSPEGFLATVEGVADAGCPFFEVGFPFSDPVADGPVIQATSAEALAAGIDLDRCFELTAQAVEKTGLAAVCMTYANLVFYLGPDEFCRRLKASGGAGLIVADVSFEESEPLAAACQKNGLDLISFLAPTTPPERRQMVASQSVGFLYLVAVRGVTGGATTFGPELQQLIADAKAATDTPVLVGFGVRGADQVDDILASGADGAIVGSALLEVVRSCNGDPEKIRAATRDFIKPMVERCGALK